MPEYLITVRKDLSFRIQAGNEDEARAMAVARADGYLPSQHHTRAIFQDKSVSIVTMTEVTA